MATIGLCMIVKDEAEVIIRCIDSVRPLVDFVMIEDTGSSDGTQDIIRNHLARIGLPGEVVDEPWKDFASNRTSALVHLRQHTEIDYALIMDADDRIVFDEAFDATAFKAGMDRDFYDVFIRLASTGYSRPQICRNSLNFYYRGVLHEFLEVPPGAITRGTAEGFRIAANSSGGARSKLAGKFERDAAVLEKALETEQDEFMISRYTFYLAQSYRDCGQLEQALKNYLARAKLGFWQEEVFRSLYSAAQLKEQLAQPEQEVINAYLGAAQALPTRAEAWHGVSHYCRSKGRNEEGYQFAKRGLATECPSGGLFIEYWIYDYGLLDELAVNGYWSGHYHESLDASLKLLEGKELPEEQRERVLKNARFAFDKLPGDRSLEAGPTQRVAPRTVAMPAKRRLFACFGVPRSGSTWMFNLVREICGAARIEYLSRYREGVENLPWDEAEQRLIVSRSHWPWDSYIAFFREHDAKGVITVRDPRDAVASLMQRQLSEAALDFQEALKQVAHSCGRLLVMQRELGLPVLRYENDFVGSTTTFDAISGMLGATLSEIDRSTILAQLMPEGVCATPHPAGSPAENLGDAAFGLDLKALEETTVNQKVRQLVKAQWQRGAIGDGTVGKFRDHLTPEQEREILNQTQEYCEKFDYSPVAEVHTAHTAALPAGNRDNGCTRLDPHSASREDERAAAGADAEPTFACCPVCGGIETTKPRPDLEPHPYVACCKCGLFYQPRMPPKVFEARHETRGDLMSEADRQANRQLAAAFYHNHLERRYKDQEIFHLDIGSKYPFFGHCLQEIAAESSTTLISHGIDGIPEAREFGRQLRVEMAVGDFEGDPHTWDMSTEMRERVTRSGFHCVSIIHCLEHFYNPLRTLRNIRRLMVEGGILFVRSPDSQAPGIERDFTPGHFEIHPTVWREEAMYEVLARLQDSFVVYETYEISHQRDYLLQAIGRKPTIGVGVVLWNDNNNVKSAIKSVSTVVDRFCVRHSGLSDSLIEDLEKLAGDRLDLGSRQEIRSQNDMGRQAQDLAFACNRYVEALDHDVDWVLRLDQDETVPPDTADIVRCAPYMPFDVHSFQIRSGTDASRHSRLWRTKRGVRYVGATWESPICPADFRVRDWNHEIVYRGVNRFAAFLKNYRTLKEEAERPEAGGQCLFRLANACRDAYGATNEKHYLEEAIFAFERCLDSDPSYSGISYRSLAVCYADLGRDWEAAAAARKAVEYAPDDEAFRAWTREHTPRVINILRPGAIGDVLASSAATAQLAARNPDIEIHYYTKAPEMAKLLVGVHTVHDADEWANRERGADFNLIGYPIAEGYPERPMRKHLTEYMCEEVRLPPGPPRLKEELQPFGIDGRWVTIHSKTGWSVYKDWGLDKWNEIVRRIHRNYPDVVVVQIGGADDPAVEGIDRDLRGRSLSQTLWLIKHSGLHLGCDSFSNHAAGAFGHPAVIVFGSTSPTGTGYDSAVNLWAGLECSPCYREDPRISRQSRGPCINPPGQEYDRPRHACMAAVTAKVVWEAIERLMPAESSSVDAGMAMIERAQETGTRANSLLPRIHLISLEPSVERLELFRNRNAHVRNFVLVPTTDTCTETKDELRRSGYIAERLSYPPRALAYALSHIRLWEMTAERGESITIFEDDVVVSHQFEHRAQQVLSLVPDDWDIIQWGYLLNPHYVWIDLGQSRFRLNVYGERNYRGQDGAQEFQASAYPVAPFRLLHSFGMQAYSISAKGARAALDCCLPLHDRFITFPDAGVRTPDEGIDVALCGAYPSLKAYLCLPQLALRADQLEPLREALDEEPPTQRGVEARGDAM